MVIYGSDLPSGVIAEAHRDGYLQRLLGRDVLRWVCNCPDYLSEDSCEHTDQLNARGTRYHPSR